MNRIYLTIKFEEKDKAKETARKNGTQIKWDGAKKRWFFDGETLPDCLEKYTYQTTQHAYARRNNDFNSFLKSDAGKKWQEKQEKIVADDLGMTIDEMREEEKKQFEEYEAELEKKPVEWFCDDCGKYFEFKGPKKCGLCGSKNVSEY